MRTHGYSAEELSRFYAVLDRAVREAAEANKFGWAHWDYNQGFGLLDETGKPDAALIDVLLPT